MASATSASVTRRASPQAQSQLQAKAPSCLSLRYLSACPHSARLTRPPANGLAGFDLAAPFRLSLVLTQACAACQSPSPTSAGCAPSVT